jgi:PAS domain S-box-containing protein
LSWNTNLERLAACSPDQLRGAAALEFFPGEDRQRAEATIRAVFTDGHAALEAQFAGRDGRRTPCYFTGVRILLDGRPILVGSGLDISERKRAEELERYGAFQAGIAEMSVSVLHNIGNAITAVANDADALRRAGDDLERVALLLARSAAEGAAHLAEEGEAAASAQAERLLAVLREASALLGRLQRDVLRGRGRRLGESVRHIADIVRIQQTAALPSTRVSGFDLARAVQDALAMQGDTLVQHGIRSEIHIDPALAQVTLSRNRLVQAMLNVIKNAYEAIRERRRLEPVDGLIRVEARPLDGERVQLTVSDNGIGIEPGQRAELFRFGYSTKNRGSGFGLHATALFVQESGGRIALESDGRGCGARLVIELPLQPASTPA